MRLKELLEGLNQEHLGGHLDLPKDTANLEIENVAADSRQVTPGALFIGVKGSNVDGHQFFKEAVDKGAVGLVGEWANPDLGVPYIQVSDSRLVLAHLAAAWNGHPAHKLVMIGVTGTDGKTTTSNLIYQILKVAGLDAGMITSVNAVIGNQKLDTGLHVTTPDATEVQRYLAEMVEAGLTHCVLETTSHGLAQHRVSACEFDFAVVTNITHEHLDYHGSFRAYREAKAMLFTGLRDTAPKKHGLAPVAVLNHDDNESFGFLNDVTSVPVVSYGLEDGADITAAGIQVSEEGLRFVVNGADYAAVVRSSLVGAYNVSNALAAFALAVEGLGLTPEVAAVGIESLLAVSGRMERIDMGQSFTAIVDFAHTPNALRRALEAARQMTEGRVIAVFGSAGLRDRKKRRMMAEISVELADITVLTAEDPRTESLDEILEEMAEGASDAGGVEGVDVYRMPDRGEAIRAAVHKAGEGDVVIACGKGHEQSMCFGETEYPWDDRVAMRAALSERYGMEGPAMPELPTSYNYGQ